MNKNKFKYRFYVLTLINALLLAGCTQTEKSTAFSVNIDGEKVYFDKGSEKDKEAQAIDEMMRGFLNHAMIADYRSHDTMAQFDFYAAADKQALIDTNNPETLAEYIKSSELISKLESYNLDSVHIYERQGKEQADITCTYITTVVNATESYCTATGQEVGKSYKRSIVMKLTKENGLWKTHYDLVPSARQEVTLENE